MDTNIVFNNFLVISLEILFICAAFKFVAEGIKQFRRNNSQRKNKSHQKRNNVIEQGYRPVGRLDTKKPPQGGSAVKHPKK